MQFVKEHLGFILTASVTYIVGILLIVVQYISHDQSVNINIMEVFLNSIIPTTITYVLGCVLVNIADLLKGKADAYVFNIFACLSVMIYALIFCIYVMIGFSCVWVIVESVLTIGLLWLNTMCYNERYQNKNHGIV